MSVPRFNRVCEKVTNKKLKVRQPATRRGPEVIHESHDGGFSTLCGTAVGRSWRVTALDTDCPECRAWSAK